MHVALFKQSLSQQLCYLLCEKKPWPTVKAFVRAAAPFNCRFLRFLSVSLFLSLSLLLCRCFKLHTWYWIPGTSLHFEQCLPGLVQTVQGADCVCLVVCGFLFMHIHFIRCWFFSPFAGETSQKAFKRSCCGSCLTGGGFGRSFSFSLSPLTVTLLLLLCLLVSLCFSLLPPFPASYLPVTLLLVFLTSPPHTHIISILLLPFCFLLPVMLLCSLSALKGFLLWETLTLKTAVLFHNAARIQQLPATVTSGLCVYLCECVCETLPMHIWMVL